ncbi:hypothetical protein PKNA1_C2_1304500 [Plasmodium knowlesi strain H]|uniref:Uncharacterized protein n=3 Tax=Plasmodium knowlesi TaxID=5850 RepID=A0A1A7VVU9_PLAKH|nr:conserved Plasmodium protein, unknown function [Plasmodium knowlesi strain H]OTN66785.1 Uncharacterized protein PKNOH_S08476000 [Plasmodium knowlesi]CAA9990085.1 conserved Plasmodium protein, unknown function [Plasmodium knowlesi strain H]SBO25753.1 hypothetical protein PKNA1_C2_1304500 [Plasmodium knowlesi strain H]SBO28557.1 hypothetical protein PKNA1_H1_1304500 [Plasmodium knowlesi strain H]VVS79559.1 conserved Plasmodium protein, unknown function [Plasmodium knowlesi strain H]
MNFTKHYFHLLVVYLFSFFDVYDGVNVNRKKAIHRLNGERSNSISMATIFSQQGDGYLCHCSVLGRCFSRNRCNALLFLMTAAAVLSVILIAILIQRATHLPLKAKAKEKRGTTEKARTGRINGKK